MTPLLLPLLFTAPVPPTLAIRLSADSPPAVEVVGLTDAQATALAALKPDAEAWSRVLRVVVAGGTAGEVAARPPLLGTYRVLGNAIRFEPRFPLEPGTAYRATFDPEKVGDPKPDIRLSPLTADMLVPAPRVEPTTAVIAVDPSARRLPENALRFYVRFSAPMSRGGVYRYLKLLRADGTQIDDPFLELDEELWSPDATRFTMLLDPGRVKSGLKPREEVGPVLEAGKRYTLVVSRDWPDANGRPLRGDYRKAFDVGPADDAPIDVGQWTMVLPVGRGGPLVVRLPKPLDRAVLQRMVWVADAAGKRVDGTLAVGGGERVLTFEPAAGRWAAGRYKLVVDTRLEDVCGNRVGEPFEVDAFKPVTRAIQTATVERAFDVR